MWILNMMHQTQFCMKTCLTQILSISRNPMRSCVFRSTGAAVIDSPPQPTSTSSSSSSANDVSSMSTDPTDTSSEPTMASETDSSLDSHTSLGALACCR